MGRPFSNNAGGMAWVFTSRTGWLLHSVHRVGELLRINAASNGLRLDQETLDALALLEAAANAYRPDAPPVPLVPVGSSRREATGKMLTTKELAERLECSDRWARGLTADEGPLTRYGSRRRIEVDEDEVLEYIATRKEDPRRGKVAS